MISTVYEQLTRILQTYKTNPDLAYVEWEQHLLQQKKLSP